MALSEVLNTFAFVQSTPATVWVVDHYLGLDSPVVDSWIDVGGVDTKIIPLSVVVTNNNTVTITFTSAYAGKVHVA